MADIIKMDYPSMEDMAKAFRDGSQTMEDIIREIQNINGQLEGGVLLGRGGDAFRSALNDKLVPAINRLKEKFDELGGDIYGALVDLRDGDHSAESRFKG